MLLLLLLFKDFVFWTDACKSVFSAIFTMPGGRNYPSDPFTDEGLNKTLHVHTMDYHFALKMKRF